MTIFIHYIVVILLHSDNIETEYYCTVIILRQNIIAKEHYVFRILMTDILLGPSNIHSSYLLYPYIQLY